MIKSKFFRKLLRLPENEVPQTKEEVNNRFYKNLGDQNPFNQEKNKSNFES